MTWLLPILRHRVTWGVGIALGVLVAIGVHGRLQYASGHRDGTVAAQALAQRDAMRAKAVADSAWSVLYASAIRARDAQRVAEKAAARSRARSAAAEARLEDALEAVRVDTLEMPSSCTALASSCANAAALWSEERDTLTALVTAQDRALMTQGDLIATEPARLAAALRDALAEQRRSFRGPSRVRWAAVGAAAGLLFQVLR
jgi:hypothetical protein